MQKNMETSSSQPQNPIQSQTESNFPESEKPQDSSESKNSKPEQQSTHESQYQTVHSLVEDTSSSSGRERLKRHRLEVAGRVWIPDMWGQEGFLKDWIDCAAFDASLVNSTIMSARDSLMEEGRRARLRIQNGC